MRRPRDSPGPLARIFGERPSRFRNISLSLPWLPEPFPHKRLADLKVGVREVPEMSQNGAFHLVEEVLQSRSVCKSFDYIRRPEIPVYRLQMQFRQLPAPKGRRGRRQGIRRFVAPRFEGWLSFWHSRNQLSFRLAHRLEREQPFGTEPEGTQPVPRSWSAVPSRFPYGYALAGAVH